MIKKQNLWFLTLFSIIIVLTVFYIFPSKPMISKNEKENEITIKVNEPEEVSSLVAMRVSLEEERQNSIDDLQKQLVNDKISNNDKNNIYEQLKYLNELQGKEEMIENQIKNKYKLNCFVKIDNSNANTICISNKHNNKIANNIMRLIQDKFNKKMFTTIKFQPNK